MSPCQSRWSCVTLSTVAAVGSKSPTPSSWKLDSSSTQTCGSASNSGARGGGGSWAGHGCRAVRRAARSTCRHRDGLRNDLGGVGRCLRLARPQAAPHRCHNRHLNRRLDAVGGSPGSSASSTCGRGPSANSAARRVSSRVGPMLPATATRHRRSTELAGQRRGGGLAVGAGDGQHGRGVTPLALQVAPAPGRTAPARPAPAGRRRAHRRCARRAVPGPGS
jgi:hypothetical protein